MVCMSTVVVSLQTVLSYAELTKDFPHFSQIEDLTISDYDKSKTLVRFVC